MIKHTLFMLALVAGFFSSSAKATSVVANYYSGYTDCNNAKAYAYSSSVYWSGRQCQVTLNLNPHHYEWTGTEFGSFTYSVRDSGSTVISERGYYQIQGGRIYLNFRGWSYPNPGGSYPFGDRSYRGFTLYGPWTFSVN